MDYTGKGMYSIHTREIVDCDEESQYVDFGHIVSIPMFYPQSIRDKTYRKTHEFTTMVDQCRMNRRGLPGLEEPFHSLKPHVKEWLDANIKPSTDKRRPLKWPWAAPLNPSVKMDVFFLRKRDAMHFMMVWAEYIEKSPI
jgi:hypothetical protein